MYMTFCNIIANIFAFITEVKTFSKVYLSTYNLRYVLVVLILVPS